MQLRFANFINIFVILTYFVYRFRYPLPNYEINQPMLYIELTIVFIYMLLFYLKALLKDVILVILILSILFIHLMSVEIVYPSSYFTNSAISLFRMFVYTFTIYIFSKYILDVKYFVDKFLSISLIVLMFTLVNHFIDLGFFYSHGYGFPRPAFMLSEPSSFAPLVSIVFVYGIAKRRFDYVLLSLSSMWVINSGLTIFVPFLALAIYTIHKNDHKLWFSSLITGLIIAYFIDLADIHSIERLYYFKDNFSLENGQMGTARLTTFYNVAIDRLDSGTLWIGSGFNTGKIMYENMDMYGEFGLLHMLFTSFGILGLSLYLILSVMALIRVRALHGFNLIYIFYISLLLSAFINSAQGAILWKFHLIIIFFIFVNKKNSKKLT
jgi:hypothetical protein